MTQDLFDNLQEVIKVISYQMENKHPGLIYTVHCTIWQDNTFLVEAFHTLPDNPSKRYVFLYKSSLNKTEYMVTTHVCDCIYSMDEEEEINS